MPAVKLRRGRKRREEEEKEEEEQRVFKRPLSLSPLIGGELGETGVMFKEVGVSELKFLSGK